MALARLPLKELATIKVKPFFDQKTIDNPTYCVYFGYRVQNVVVLI